MEECTKFVGEENQTQTEKKFMKERRILQDNVLVSNITEAKDLGIDVKELIRQAIEAKKNEGLTE